MKQSNYEKAKEEGIKNFRELEAIAWRFNPLEPIYADENKKDLAYLESFLSSFAEKIKEGRDEDIRSKLITQKEEDFEEQADPVHISIFCKGYNACKEYIEWILDGSPELKN